MMKCNKCGTVIIDNAKFCNKCGNILNLRDFNAEFEQYKANLNINQKNKIAIETCVKLENLYNDFFAKYILIEEEKQEHLSEVKSKIDFYKVKINSGSIIAMEILVKITHLLIDNVFSIAQRKQDALIEEHKIKTYTIKKWKEYELLLEKAENVSYNQRNTPEAIDLFKKIEEAQKAYEDAKIAEQKIIDINYKYFIELNDIYCNYFNTLNITSEEYLRTETNK